MEWYDGLSRCQPVSDYRDCMAPDCGTADGCDVCQECSDRGYGFKCYNVDEYESCLIADRVVNIFEGCTIVCDDTGVGKCPDDDPDCEWYTGKYPRRRDLNDTVRDGFVVRSTDNTTQALTDTFTDDTDLWVQYQRGAGWIRTGPRHKPAAARCLWDRKGNHYPCTGGCGDSNDSLFESPADGSLCNVSSWDMYHVRANPYNSITSDTSVPFGMNVTSDSSGRNSSSSHNHTLTGTQRQVNTSEHIHTMPAPTGTGSKNGTGGVPDHRHGGGTYITGHNHTVNCRLVCSGVTIKHFKRLHVFINSFHSQIRRYQLEVN